MQHATHPRTTLSIDYYHRLISFLIKYVNVGLSDQDIAGNFNSIAFLAPSGKPFTANIVRQILRKLRNHQDYPSKIHKALLQLVFEGRLSAPDTYCLFAPRKTPGAM